MNEMAQNVQMSGRPDFSKKEDLVKMIKLNLLDGTINYLKAGARLIQLKKMCDHGEFQSFVNSEFRMSKSTCHGLMQAYNKFGDDKKKVSGMGISLVIELSKENVSEEVQEKVFDAHNNGVTPTVRDVRKMKKEEEMQKKQNDLPKEISSPPLTPIYDVDGEDVTDDILSMSEPKIEFEDVINQVRDIYILLDTSINTLENINICREVDEKRKLKSINLKYIAATKRLRAIYDPTEQPSMKVVNERLSDDQAVELVELLCESISANCKKVPLPSSTSVKYDNWLLEMKKLSRNFDADHDEIQKVIGWIKDHQNNNFRWGEVIQSVRKLYEKYPMICTQMESRGLVVSQKESIVVDDGKDWGNHG